MKKNNPRGKTARIAGAQRRQYNSPLRREQAVQTRERIVGAGAEIAHQLASWDWRALTFKAVGERAGVSERTVHRYFATEKLLRDAIVQRLVQESGISLDALALDNFADVASSVYGYLLSFAATPAPINDPTQAAIDQHRCDALLAAVSKATPGWSAAQRTTAAALLDMLWNPPSCERLATVWRLDAEQAKQALRWSVSLIQAAIAQDQRPG